MASEKAKTAIIFSSALKDYDFGWSHPFRGDRFTAFLKLYQEVLGDDERFVLIENEGLASDEELGLWHIPDYIQAMKAASLGTAMPGIKAFISDDNLNPSTGRFPRGIERAARAAVKNSLIAVNRVQQGINERAISIGGGLHHALPDYGEGFCIYNDVVIAIKHALQSYELQRILVLDTDAHAGNGTSAAFYEDPRVLFIDWHQVGIYPGTGSVDEIGAKAGQGFTINFPLLAGTSDAAYAILFDQVVFPLAREYRPQMIIRYGGSDPYYEDELTDLGLTLKGFEMIGRKVRQLSIELGLNSSVDFICSGYHGASLPQVWLTLIMGLTGLKTVFRERASSAPMQHIKHAEAIVRKTKQKLGPYWKSLN